MARNELNRAKQEKAHERLKTFRAELSDYRQTYQRLKGSYEEAQHMTTQNRNELFTRRPHHASTPENPYAQSTAQSSLPSSSPLLSSPSGSQPQYRNSAGQLSFGASPEDYTRENAALREQSFMSQTNAQLDEYLERGRAVLGDLGQQREMLKGTQKRLYGVANTLGVSGETIKMVERVSTYQQQGNERNSRQDKANCTPRERNRISGYSGLARSSSSVSAGSSYTFSDDAMGTRNVLACNDHLWFGKPNLVRKFRCILCIITRVLGA